ncbi:MAG: translation initiation factor IF-2 [Bacteroidetes bacterium]|nr:translation initiation factor IF-2 [Bacteroidota bacterium]
MSEGAVTVRLSKAAREFNIGISTVVEYLSKKGFTVDRDPNGKLNEEMYNLLKKEFATEKQVKEEAKKIELAFTSHQTITIEDKKSATKEREKEREDLFIKNVSLDYDKRQMEPPRKPKEAPVKEVPQEPAMPEPKPAEAVKPVVEKAKPAEPAGKEEKKPAKKVAAEIPTDEKAEDLNQESSEKETKKHTKKTKEEAGEPPLEIKEEKQNKGVGELKIVGKMDLGTFEKKPSKKVKAKTEAPAVVSPEEPATVEAAEILQEPEAAPPEMEIPAELPAGEAIDLNFLPTAKIKLEGPTILGSMILPEPKKFEKKKQLVASSSDDSIKSKKKKRKRIKRADEGPEAPKTDKPHFTKDKKYTREIQKPEVTQEDIERQIKETLARLSPTGKSKASKYRRQKREEVSQKLQQEQERIEEGKKVIKVTEFVTANELANMMHVAVTEIISTCMSLGLFVSINQRLDAETLTLVADEFGYKLEFVSVEVQEAIDGHNVEDNPDDIRDRAPIVTVMGHVDHGKTKLLDFIRSTNVVAGEAGGITQHIGAYEVVLDNGKAITFLDTPGHEAFTAMRARGAKITDVAIIVIAADETVMPQTKEAINHAMAAGVPIVFAINKIDKANSNPEKIREELSKMNVLVEEWGGKYQTQEISAKTGLNINILLDKVLLEAEMLNLKANPSRLAIGTVIESSLDKGRGYVAKLLVQNGTMHIGDIVLAGATYGRIKAMYNERNQPIKEAGPSAPVLMLGLNGAPQAGDSFNVMTDEKETKNIATKRLQLQREQGLRTQKHITLDEIGRRIAIGEFKELNIIVKGDVDGSVEALSDSLLKLTNEEVAVNVIHKSVGQITESDVLLASASNAVIVGFQVRPSVSARKLAEAEQIDIRLYSIIYQAIEEIKSAIEGMLAPEIEEKITSNIEIREVFKITKVGTVAGCMVLDGKITRQTTIRVIRDGIVVYTGKLGSLKRFKDDAREVSSGFECGLNIDNFNDIKVGDIIEGYEQIEIKRKL